MTDFLLLAFIFLIAGVVMVPLASKFKLGSVLGYLIAGILISPILAFLNVDVVSLQHFAEFGVVMMLFLVGLELEPKMLWEMRHKLLGLGGLQVAGTALAVMGVALAFGQPWRIALAIGLVFALSSTAIVLQTLNEKGLMKSDGGQASFSVLLFQDIAVIPMLALIPLLAMPEILDSHMATTTDAHGSTATTLVVDDHGSDTHSAQTDSHGDHSNDGHGDGGHGPSLSLVDGLNGWQTALVTLGAIAFVFVVGIYLTRPLFNFISTAGLRELFTATALLIVIGIALLMSLVGVSPALGTFIAGVVLANSEYRHELESDVEPFKGLLLGLFFMTVGAAIDFDLLFNNLGGILGLTLGLILLKAAILTVLAFIFKIKGSDRWLMALGLAQAGEFGFVLLSYTVANSVIPTELADRLMLVVALSMLLTPLLFILVDKVIAALYSESQEEMDEITEQGDVIIIGHGRVGGIVNRMMRGYGYKTTVIDYSSSQLEMLRTFGFRIFFGDGTRPDLLHAAGIEKAKLLVVAIDNKEQITELVRYAVKQYPNVHVTARAVDRTHVYHLWAVGCRDIIRESYDSSLRMGRSAIEAMGVPVEEAQRFTDEFQKLDRETMIELASLYDVDIPPLENEPYVKRVKELVDDWEQQLRGRMEDGAPSEKEGTSEDSGSEDYQGKPKSV